MPRIDRTPAIPTLTWNQLRAMAKPINAVDQIEKLWGRITLADLRQQAVKEFNGTAYQAIRPPGRQRFFMACCVTGEHELTKARKAMGDLQPTTLPKWAETSLLEGVARAVMAGGLIYAFDNDNPAPQKPLVLISGDPDSTARLATLLGIDD